MAAAASSRAAAPAEERRRSHWVSETRDERFDGVRAVVVQLDAGRVELGSRRSGRAVRVRTTLAVTGWRSRLARRREPSPPGAEVVDGVLRLVCPKGQVRAQVDLPAGLPVEASVMTGDLTLWGVGGDLALRVSEGILAGRDLLGPTVRAINDHGEVNLHFAASPARLDATSGTGPLVLVLPHGVYSVDAEDDAEVTVEVDPGAPAIVRTRSGGRTAVLAARGSEPI